MSICGKKCAASKPKPAISVDTQVDYHNVHLCKETNTITEIFLK